jgi:hypothetical protein
VYSYSDIKRKNNMRTMCEINRLIETGEITSFAQKAPHDVHSMDQGKYHGSMGMTNTPDPKEPFYYQVFKLGDKDRQIIAHGMQSGMVYQLIQHGGAWGAWKEMDGRSAYQIWLDEGHVGSKAEFLASLKGAKGDDGSHAKSGWATHAEIVQGVNNTKAINPQGLNWGKLMSKGGSPTDKFEIPDKADLNDYKVLGMYSVKSSAFVIANAPTSEVGMLTVMDDGSAAVYQTYHAVGSSRIYTRSFTASAWTHWAEHITTANDSFSERSERFISRSIAKNLDTLNEGWVLVSQAGSTNAPTMTGEIYFYIMTIPFGNKQQKLQVAYGYTHGRTMATRVSFGNKWKPWSYYGSMVLSGTTLTITL